MLTRAAIGFLVLISLAGTSADVSAQLFGDRQVGRNANTPSTPPLGGIVQGFERFLRGNRSEDSFVGAGSAAASAFAGGSQANTAADTASSSVIGLTEEAAPPVNRVKQRKTAGIYAERLTADFQPSSRFSTAPPERPVISQRLSDIAANRNVGITVSKTTREATVVGTVDSQHEKRIAELLVLFEPGIETVTNELHVAPRVPR